MIGFIEHFGTARDYILQFTILHTSANVHSYICTGRCSVAASNNVLYLSSGSPNYHRPRQEQRLKTTEPQQFSNSRTEWLTQTLTN
jgi:hypothetical protein